MDNDEGIPTRAQHLESCKRRALEKVRYGELKAAWKDFAREMRGHPETAEHPWLVKGDDYFGPGKCFTVKSIRDFLEAFF